MKSTEQAKELQDLLSRSQQATSQREAQAYYNTAIALLLESALPNDKFNVLLYALLAEANRDR